MSLETLYKQLDFQPGIGLATEESPPQDFYQAQLFKVIRDRLGIDSVFFCQTPSGNSAVPYIYFSSLKSFDPEEIQKLHRLAWNMGRAPLLFASLPDGTVRIYNTYEPPSQVSGSQDYQTGLVDVLNLFSTLESERLKLVEYQRREFESGRYWLRNNQRFDPKKRADQTLLGNLRFMHGELQKELAKRTNDKNASEIAHRLLIRSIFLKYLEDRKDLNGKNVFPEGFFSQFFRGASSFVDILDNKEATYHLFDALNAKFNGDLFPATSDEKKIVTKELLQSLSLFLTGNAVLKRAQLTLWKHYSFDVIPIEFISTIYEEFFHILGDTDLKKKPEKIGTHYTRHHLVELLVDEVFPWSGFQTNFKTLDPACGSGIFLVEVYRRLIAHWQQAHLRRKIKFDHLKKLLVDNIYGVDIDSGAIHVAAFSLCLTLCDFLEPREIWEEVVFPTLTQEKTGKNLVRSDFFKFDIDLPIQDFDLVIGNPPWKTQLTADAKEYVARFQKQNTAKKIAPGEQLALPFLRRSADFCRPNGQICLLMPSKGLLFNRSENHLTFRRDFLTDFDVKTIINFSASRHIMFDKASGPAAAVIYKTDIPDDKVPILYCSPKPTYSLADSWQVNIESQDIAQLSRQEARENPFLWKIAMWGSSRDLALVKKLMSSSFQTLEKVANERNWIHGEGVQEGKEENRVHDASWLVGKPYVSADSLKRFTFDTKNLPSFELSKLQRPRPKTRAIFEPPHLIIKQSPLTGETSFRAAMLTKDAVFTNSFVGIHGPQDDVNMLAQLCLIINSQIPLYFALMSSGRWLVERDELNKEEIMDFPVPSKLFQTKISYEFLKNLSRSNSWEKKVSDLVDQMYGLDAQERVLVSDAIEFTLDYFRNKSGSSASKPATIPMMQQYVKEAQEILETSFSKKFMPIIFSADSPLRVVGFKVNSDRESDDVVFEKSQSALETALQETNKHLLENRSPGIFVRRNVRCYVGDMIYIVKPDQSRYWTRSNALRDADEIYADIMTSWSK